MKHNAYVPTGQLIVLGGKRDWVPMWLWMNVIFRLGIYEVWPILWLFYIPKKSKWSFPT